MDTKFSKMPAYQRAIAKGHLGSCGVQYNNLNKPVIAVVNSWNEIVPGHCHLRALADDVKKGIIAAGGYPLEFNTIAICDGIAQGHGGMKYVLASRELIADSIETMINGHGIFDGMVLMGSCDKIVPAMLMAAGRLNIPTAMVTGGPMVNRIKPYQSKEARQKFLRGEINEEELFNVTVDYYPTAGICPFLGTANTMSIVAETLGISLPGSSLIPALDEGRRKIAYQTGEAIMNLVAKDIKARDIMTREAFENTIGVISAMGGSLNTVLHIPAIAHECKLHVGYADFDRISRQAPLITRVVPNSKEYTVADLYPVGGIPTIMKELSPIMHLDVLNASGRTLGEGLETAKAADGTVIRSMKEPFEAEGGIAVLQGNLAPEGAVVKSSAVPEELWVFRGPAKVFNSEEECIAAIDEGKLCTGDAAIIRYEGPKGGPGMREMHRTTEIVTRLKNVAIITDGRFSGATGGLSIGYLSPEAAAGGPIGWVEDGDIIHVDIPNRRIEWQVSEEVIASRREKYSKPLSQATDSEYLKLYSKNTTSASRGAVRCKQ